MNFGGIIAGAIGGAAEAGAEYSKGQWQNQQKVDLESMLNSVMAERDAAIQNARKQIDYNWQQREGATVQAGAQQIASNRAQTLVDARDKNVAQDLAADSYMPGMENQVTNDYAQRFQPAINSTAQPTREDYLTAGLQSGQLPVSAYGTITNKDEKTAMLGEIAQGRRDNELLKMQNGLEVKLKELALLQEKIDNGGKLGTDDHYKLTQARAEVHDAEKNVNDLWMKYFDLGGGGEKDSPIALAIKKRIDALQPTVQAARDRLDSVWGSGGPKASNLAPTKPSNAGASGRKPLASIISGVNYGQ